MKRTILKLVLITICLLASGAVPARASGGYPPLCYHGQPACPVNLAPFALSGASTNEHFSGPGQPPFCYPGEPQCPVK